MSDREEEMGRVAAREQQEQEQDTAEDVDTEQEDTAEPSEVADDAAHLRVRLPLRTRLSAL